VHRGLIRVGEQELTGEDEGEADAYFAPSWPTRRELGAAMFEYIEVFYNRKRRHSTLGYSSPREFEMITHPAQLEDQEAKR
jgi:transposase InsO family protein